MMYMDKNTQILEHYIALSLYLGADIIPNETNCEKCKEEVGLKGHHALHCN